MANIRVMPEALANKIAAGEVVERPSSVVKELVENGIDAGASQIAVEIQGSGCRTIRVIDNGCGMEEDDVLLALERHATSKIRRDEDLNGIQTLGFRGEALPSLAVVSKFELMSRTRESTVGTRIRVVAGVVKEVLQCGCPPGTQVVLRDLFFNQPARRKFLKTERTEFAHIQDTLIRLALARPDIHFSLRHRGRHGHDWPAAADLQQRLAQVFPKKLTQSWLSCGYQQGVFHIRGYLSPPELSRSNTRMLFLHVNGRAVRDRLLNAALLKAYRTLLPKGQFPLGVLFVELPPELVDVNVHPTKAEVRFQDPQAISRTVTQGATTALTDMKMQKWQRPSGVSHKLHTVPIQRQLKTYLGEGHQVAAPSPLSYDRSSARIDSPRGEAAADAVESQQRDPRTLSGALAIIGQLHQSYILCEAEDGLILIDQHAAHERVHFEALRTEAALGSLASQSLMVPATLEVTAEEAAWLENSQQLFMQLGFKLDPFGSLTFVVRAVPAMTLRQDPISLLGDLVANGCSGESYPAAETVLERLLQSMACQLAIKAGQRLATEEMVALVQQIEGLDQYSTCPHGRPLWWKLTMAEVERIFGRS